MKGGMVCPLQVGGLYSPMELSVLHKLQFGLSENGTFVTYTVCVSELESGLEVGQESASLIVVSSSRL